MKNNKLCGHVARMGRVRCVQYFVGNPKERGHLDDRELYGIILKLVFKK
jgi:hypothetical protein